MNLVQIGRRTLNLDLVAYFEDEETPDHPSDEPGAGDAITITLWSGANLRFTGIEAADLRLYLAENSRRISSAPPLSDFASGHDVGPGDAQAGLLVPKS